MANSKAADVPTMHVDEVQALRERQANAGLAHASMNGIVPGTEGGAGTSESKGTTGVKPQGQTAQKPSTARVNAEDGATSSEKPSATGQEKVKDAKANNAKVVEKDPEAPAGQPVAATPSSAQKSGAARTNASRTNTSDVK